MTLTESFALVFGALLPYFIFGLLGLAAALWLVNWTEKKN